MQIVIEKEKYMASPERGGFSESLKKFNKLTLVGALGIAAFGAYFAPVLVAPALAAAALDVGSIAAINTYQDWRKNEHAHR